MTDWLEALLAAAREALGPEEGALPDWGEGGIPLPAEAGEGARRGPESGGPQTREAEEEASTAPGRGTAGTGLRWTKPGRGRAEPPQAGPGPGPRTGGAVGGGEGPAAGPAPGPLRREPLRLESVPWEGIQAERGGAGSLYFPLRRAGAAADYSRQESRAAALQLQEGDRGRAAGPEELDRAFRRDARRYDGGSFLY